SRVQVRLELAVCRHMTDQLQRLALDLARLRWVLGKDIDHISLGDAPFVVGLVGVGDDLGDAVRGRGGVGLGEGGRYKADSIAAVLSTRSEVELAHSLSELADSRQTGLATTDEYGVLTSGDEGGRLISVFALAEAALDGVDRTQ